MKSKIQVLLAGFATLFLAAGCSRSGKESAGATPPAPAAEPESRVKSGTNGDVIVTLDAATQKAMGLQTATLRSARLSQELKGYGRVMDPSALAALVAELTSALAQNEASQAELTRLKSLEEQKNASERALQSAQAAATRDRAQVAAVRLRLLSTWGAGIAERQDLPAFVLSLGSLDSALVEIDLPADASVTGMPTGAQFMTLAPDSKPIDAQFIGPATSVDPQMQGRGFVFLVNPNPARLAPGTAVTGFLKMPGGMQSGVILPREAVVRHNGATWIYVQTADDKFQRTEVVLDRPLENGWFVRHGLDPKDKVVTVGAQQILSEELKGQAE